MGNPCCAAPPLHERMKSFFTGCFWSYGQLVSQHPFVVIITCVTVMMGLGMGMFALEFEKDTEALYYPRGSRAIRDRSRIKEIFTIRNNETFSLYSQFTFQSFFRLVFEANDVNDSIFEPPVLVEIGEILTDIQKLNGSDGLLLENICAKFQNRCVIDGVEYLSQLFVDAVKAGLVQYPIWHQPGRYDVDVSYNIARAVTGSNDVLRRAGVIKVTFMLFRDPEWSRAAVKYMKNKQTKYTSVAYEGTHSLNEELDDATRGDKWLFLMTLCVAITYAIVATMGGDAVSTRAMLSFMGVMAAGLGIFGAIGFLAACGLKFANIVGITPFLVIGIGVDDMFLLMSSWSETLDQPHLSVPDRISTTLAFAGIGITVTSLTDLLAFFIGATSIFFSVEVFCIFTGLAVLFVYCCQVTLFVACLSLHGRRVYSSRHCLTCLPTKPQEQLKAEGRSLLYRFLCGGSVPSQVRAEESVCERGPSKWLPKVIVYQKVCYFILVAFSILLGFSLYGYTRVQQGLDLSELVNKDSYYKHMDCQLIKYFRDRTPIQFVIDGELDYTTSASRRKITDLLAKAQRDRQVQKEINHCWFTRYLTSSDYDQNNFFVGLGVFLLKNPIFVPDISFADNDINSQRIVASRCSVTSIPLRDEYEQADLMVRMREVADASPLPVFAYYWTFITGDGLLQTFPSTMFTLGMAVVAMVIVCLIFLPHPFMVALVTFNILMILANIFGFMYFMEIKLSAVTMIHLIMSVGFSVDFSAHVCSAYLMSNSLSRTQRAYDAITHAASPIFNGGMSSLVGVCLLLFSNSYIFLTFFKIMVLVIVFGMLNAVLFVPAVLRLIGPENRARVKPDVPDSPGHLGTTNETKADTQNDETERVPSASPNNDQRETKPEAELPQTVDLPSHDEEIVKETEEESKPDSASFGDASPETKTQNEEA